VDVVVCGIDRYYRTFFTVGGLGDLDREIRIGGLLGEQ
jgi:hypothetical protein